jgi:hypothetical protein
LAPQGPSDGEFVAISRDVSLLLRYAALSELADEASSEIPAGAALDLREGWIFGV